MAGNELIAGIAGLAEGFGSFMSERHKLRLEREEKKERKAATEYARSQDAVQNTLRQGQLEAENRRIDASAKVAQDRADYQKLQLEYRMKRDAAKDAADKKKIDLQYADKFAALGENVFDVAHYIDAYDPGSGQAPTMPGMAPGSPAQTGNAPPGANMQAPQVPNQQAPAMSTLGSGRIPSPVQTPQLQMGQPAGAPSQQGQPVPMQGQAQQVPQQLRPGTRTPDTRAGAGIVFNQNQGANAAAQNDKIKKETEHVEAEIETANNNRRIQNLELEGRLTDQQQKIRAADDKHRISKQEELLNSAKYDNEVALGKLHATQAQIAFDLRSTTEKFAKQKVELNALGIDIKKMETTGVGKDPAGRGQKEAEEAGKDLDKLAKERVETEGAAAYLWGLLSRNGVPIPNPDKDKGRQAMNNLISKPDDLRTNYKATLERLSEINDRWFQSRYHESEGEYLKALGTRHVSDGGGPEDKKAEADKENARQRFQAAKDEYLGLMKKKEKERTTKGVGPMPVFPNFTTEKKHFTNGNTKHDNKKKPGSSDPLGILH